MCGFRCNACRDLAGLLLVKMKEVKPPMRRSMHPEIYENLNL